jgi:hypothetical protein
MCSIVRHVALETPVVLSIAHAIVQHLKSANASPDVVGMYERCTIWVALGEKDVQRLGTLLCRNALVAQPTVISHLTRRKVHLVDNRIEIEARSPTKNRNSAALKKLIHAGAGIVLEALDRIVLVHVGHINHKKGHAPLGNRCLCCSHVHATIDLHGIDRDNR